MATRNTKVTVSDIEASCWIRHDIASRQGTLGTVGTFFLIMRAIKRIKKRISNKPFQGFHKLGVQTKSRMN